MLKRLLGLSGAALALSGAALAQAEDGEVLPACTVEPGEVVVACLRLETVDVAGLRPVAVADLSSSVSVLEAGDLALRDAPYLADQLRAVPGVGVSRSGAVGGLTQVRIRGGEANHTLVLLNGIEVSDPTTGETDFGLWAGLNAARIEVARGEQSALYGSDAIGGVVSVTVADAAGARGMIEAGSRGSYRFGAGYGAVFERGGLNFTLASSGTDGVDTSGLDGETDGSQSTSGLVTGQIELERGWQVSGLAHYAYGQVDTDPDLNFDGRLDNADRVTESRQWTVGGAISGDAAGLNHLIRASYSDVARENFSDGALGDETIGQRSKLSYSPSKLFALDAGEVTVSSLIDWESEDYERVGLASFFGDPNQSASFDTLGLAGEVRGSFEALALNASVRHDNNDGRFENVTTWRSGAAYSFDNGAKVRASAGTGVKNPTFVELFGFFPGSFIGNPDLKPEQSTSWEIGWDQDFGDVQTSLSYFSAALEDEIFTQFNPDFTSSPANRSGDSERSGVEAALRWRVSDALSLSGGVSNISSENDSGVQEIRVPEWTGSLALDWRSESKDGLRVGLAADYVGEQLDTDFGTFQTVELEPYWLVSATVEYPLNERLSLTLRGDNLLDQTVTDVFGFHAPGAGVFVGLKLR